MFRRRRGGARVRERDLRSLDRDLRQIVIEERCSYGAELRAELAEEHNRLASGRRTRWWSAPEIGIAAVLMLTLAGSLAVAGMRGAIPGLARSTGGAETARSGTLRPGAEEVVRPEPAVSGSVAEGSVRPNPDVRVEPSEIAPLSPLRPGTVPELADRDAARLIVAQEYPAVLQRRGIGGRVRLLMWVGPDGTTEFPQIEGTSGLRELDLAALRATRSLRFVPATLLGEAVGTWVSFSIRFQPGGTDLAQPDPEYAAFHIPLSN